MARHLKPDRYIDPVCNMAVEPETAPAKSCYNGVEIYFCAQGCKVAFEANPSDYISKKKKGFWQRYIDRLTKATGGKPQRCH